MAACKAYVFDPLKFPGRGKRHGVWAHTGGQWLPVSDWRALQSHKNLVRGGGVGEALHQAVASSAVKSHTRPVGWVRIISAPQVVQQHVSGNIARQNTELNVVVSGEGTAGVPDLQRLFVPDLQREAGCGAHPSFHLGAGWSSALAGVHGTLPDHHPEGGSRQRSAGKIVCDVGQRIDFLIQNS